MAFVGINGVGKSTSLAKVAYYLKENGIKVCRLGLVLAIVVYHLKILGNFIFCSGVEDDYDTRVHIHIHAPY